MMVVGVSFQNGHHVAGDNEWQYLVHGSFAASDIIGGKGGIVGSRGYDVVHCIAVHVIGNDSEGSIN